MPGQQGNSAFGRWDVFMKFKEERNALQFHVGDKQVQKWKKTIETIACTGV